MERLTGTVVGLVLLVAMAAGVGLLRSSDEPVAGPVVTTGPTAVTMPVTSTTSGTTTSMLAARACRASDLQVRIEGSQGLGGTTYTPLVFKNRSSTACTLSGHPRVTFSDRTGRVIGRASPTPLIDPPVTAGPGQRAVADLMVGSQSLGDCRPVSPATIRVDVGDGGAITIAANGFRVCPSEITGINQYSCPQLGCDQDHA